jgi:hypothetical protein
MTVISDLGDVRDASGSSSAGPWDGPTAAPDGDVARLDAAAACTFLQSQARWLTHALANADDPEVVGTVLGMHDASHASWLHLLAATGERDVDAAAQLVTLYGFHGQVVGSLERGVDCRLSIGVQVEVRRLIARRLELLTDEAVALVEEVAGGS